MIVKIKVRTYDICIRSVDEKERENEEKNRYYLVSGNAGSICIGQ